MKQCLKVSLFISLFTIHFSLFTVSYAAHPLITDDTGTQGKGKFQIELTWEYGHDKEDGVKENSTEVASILSYGVTDNMDIVLGVPAYSYVRIADTEEEGIADISIELKWHIYEKDGLNFAIKPGITFPTGNDEKGLGAGKVTYGLFFITTKGIEPWAFHLNLGYIRHENKVDERENIWHASMASEVEIIKDLKAVANIGIERNPDKTSNTHPAFILGGIIYSITEDFDIDFGIKGGLNKVEVDYSMLAGLTFRF